MRSHLTKELKYAAFLNKRLTFGYEIVGMDEKDILRR